MVYNKADDDFNFESYMRFNFHGLGSNYADKPIYLASIKKEFLLQIERLQQAVDEVNSENGSIKLELTCISNHHNVVFLSRDLFKVYCAVANEKKLVSRSPKLLPEQDRKNYYGRLTHFSLTVGALKEKCDARNFVKELANNTCTSHRFDLRAPSFSDGRVFAALGAVFGGNNSRMEAIKTRKNKIFDAIFFAVNDYRADYNNQQLISEIIFHLGQYRSFDERVISKEMLEGYTGINTTYFNNRINETEALEQIYENRNGTVNNFWQYFENAARWSDAPLFFLR